MDGCERSWPRSWLFTRRQPRVPRRSAGKPAVPHSPAETQARRSPGSPRASFLRKSTASALTNGFAKIEHQAVGPGKNGDGMNQVKNFIVA
jgi:hypothetical protein